MPEVLLGFTVPKGEPFHVNRAHTVITGTTNISGKTTAVEAILQRSKVRSLVFLTKRGEKTFQNANTIPPYYYERFDWRYLRSLLESTMHEKLKFETPWIIKISKQAEVELKTQLKDRKPAIGEGLRMVRKLLGSAMQNERLRDIDRNMYTLLAAYLDIVLPILESARMVFVDTLKLQPGINVMDLTEWYSHEEVQMLVIRSCMEQILEHENNITVALPESWKLLPQGRNTPVKLYFEKFIREGATNDNYLIIDSMPSYEVLFIRRNKLIETTTFVALYTQIQTVPSICGYEETKTVDDIEVLSSASGRLSWVPLKHIARHPYKGILLRVNPRAGLIDVSPNHPVMKYPKYNVPAESLVMGDRLCMRQFEKGRHHNNDVQLYVGTKDLAWFYGFYVAEGWINNRHVCLANKNRELLEKAQQVIATNFHLNASFTSPRREVYCLDLTSPRLAEYMKYSCYTGPKISKYTKKVPTDILNAPLEIKKAFLEGYIQGDGHIADTGQISMASASRELILGLTWLLHCTHEQCGFTVHVRNDKPRVTQLCVNTGKGKHRVRDEIKKVIKIPYEGYLYDIEVESKDHTFNMGIGNIRVHNSQDLGGTDKSPLRQVSIWIMGRMMQYDEVERLLKQTLSLDIPAQEIQTLPLGHFLVAAGDKVTKIYVWPHDVPEEMAVNVAKGGVAPETVKAWIADRNHKKMDLLTQRVPFDSDGLLNRIKFDLSKLTDTVSWLSSSVDGLSETMKKHVEDTVLHQPLGTSSGTEEATLQKTRKVVSVEEKTRNVALSDETAKGKIMWFAKAGLLDDWRSQNEIEKALEDRAWSLPRISIFRALKDLVKDGFLGINKTDKPQRYKLSPNVTFKEE